MSRMGVAGAGLPAGRVVGARPHDRPSDRARALLTEVYGSEIADLLEPGERPLAYLRVGDADVKGFCYLTDANLWWTRERRGGVPEARGRIRLADIIEVTWVDPGRFAVVARTAQRRPTTTHVFTARGRSRRVTRFVWDLSAAVHAAAWRLSPVH